MRWREDGDIGAGAGAAASTGHGSIHIHYVRVLGHQKPGKKTMKIISRRIKITNEKNNERRNKNDKNGDQN